MNDKFVYESCARCLSTYSQERITVGRLEVFESNDPTSDCWLAFLDGSQQYAFQIPKSCSIDDVMEGDSDYPPPNSRRVVGPPLVYAVTINGEIFFEPGIRELCKRVRQYLEENSFGARDVGSQFQVDQLYLPDGASRIGVIYYNGNFASVEQLENRHV